MELSEDLVLYKKQASTGRFIYFTSIIAISMLVFVVTLQSSNWLQIVIAFILSSVLATVMQLRNYIFRNFPIAVFFRLALIVTIFSVFNEIYLGLHTIHSEDSNFILYCGAMFLTIVSSLFIGGFLSIPFKMMTYFLGNFESIEDIYVEGRELPYSEDQMNEWDSVNIYDAMNETELEVALKNALIEEKYEEAEKIRNALDRL